MLILLTIHVLTLLLSVNDVLFSPIVAADAAVVSHCTDELHDYTEDKKERRTFLHWLLILRTEKELKKHLLQKISLLEEVENIVWTSMVVS